MTRIASKLKISLTAIAFVLSIGLAFASGASEGWYVPDESGSGPNSNPPAQCNGSIDLCATHYNAQGQADDFVYLPD